MDTKKILKISLIILSVVFLGFQLMTFDVAAESIRALLFVMLVILYYYRVKNKNMFFFMFLLSFTLAEIINIISIFVDIDYNIHLDYFYYIANGLYILSYLFLIIRVVQGVNVKEVFSKFYLHMAVLLILDIFCVIVVSDTTENSLNFSQYMLEFVYNSVIMLLLTVALINYIYKNNLKAMNLLIGAIFIFFSEVIQLTYFYIAEINVLNVICSLFLVLAFTFFYLQARIPKETDLERSKQNLYL